MKSWKPFACVPCVDVSWGFTQTEIADLLGVRRETVCPWWSAYADGGLDAAAERAGARRPRFGPCLSDLSAVPVQHLLRTPQMRRS